MGGLTLKCPEKYASIWECEKIETMRKATVLFPNYRGKEVFEGKIDLMH